MRVSFEYTALDLIRSFRYSITAQRGYWIFFFVIWTIGVACTIPNHLL